MPEKTKNKRLENMFNSLVDSGLDPLSGYFTIYSSPYEDYERYAESRLRLIERGEDLVYKMVTCACLKIKKIK